MFSPLHQRAETLGAARGEIAGRSVPRHFGDTLAEYRAVREGAGIVDRSDLACIRVWGRDPVRMVQGLITNDLAGAPEGQGVYAAMLSAKGRMIAELRAFRLDTPEGAEVLLVLPREALDGTVAHLKKFVPPMFARWADVSDERGMIGVYGPRSRELVARVLDLDLPDMPEDGFATAMLGESTCLVARTLYAGGEDGYDLVAPADSLPALWDALLGEEAGVDARPVGWGALETLRIEAGHPRYGAELTEDTIPTEAYDSTGMVNRAISFTKGCYTGQEVIIRIAHRGHVNRHLRGLLLGDSPTPGPRTPLFHPETGKEIGWTTSAAVSPRLGQSVALAYVRREVGPGGTVRLAAADGGEVEVASLPFTRPPEE